MVESNDNFKTINIFFKVTDPFIVDGQDMTVVALEEYLDILRKRDNYISNCNLFVNPYCFEITCLDSAVSIVHKSVSAVKYIEVIQTVFQIEMDITNTDEVKEQLSKLRDIFNEKKKNNRALTLDEILDQINELGIESLDEEQKEVLNSFKDI